MQNLFGIKSKKSLSLFLGLVAFFMLFAPDAARADIMGCMNMEGANIFKIMACKVTSTLADIRRIIYVLAGFGIIAFTFAAIFNKISFKHLANIGFSLFLLSMLTPFIEYFTGAKAGKDALEFGVYLNPEYSAKDYSDIQMKGRGYDDLAPKPIPQVASKGITYSIGARPIDTRASQKIDARSFTPSTLDGAIALREESGIKFEGIEARKIEPSTLSAAIAMREDPAAATAGSDILSGTTGEKEKKSVWQQLKDLKDDVVKFKNTGDTVLHGTKDIIKQGKSITKTVKNAKNIGELASAVTTGARGLQSITGTITSVGGAVNNNYGKVDENGKRGGGQGIADIFAGINKGAENVGNAGKDVGGINGAAKGMGDWGKIMKGI